MPITFEPLVPEGHVTYGWTRNREAYNYYRDDNRVRPTGAAQNSTDCRLFPFLAYRGSTETEIRFFAELRKCLYFAKSTWNRSGHTTVWVACWPLSGNFVRGLPKWKKRVFGGFSAPHVPPMGAMPPKTISLFLYFPSASAGTIRVRLRRR